MVEEIARAYGYDRIEPALPSGGMPLTARPARRAATMAAGQVLRGYGLDELVTFSYHSAAEFDRLMLPPDHPWRLSIPLANPMTEDQARMRTSLVPNLLRVLGYNAGYGVTDLHAFEINRVYLPQSLPLTDLPSEPLRVAIVLTGTAPGAANWRGGGGPVDFYLLKGVIEGLAESMRLDNLSFEPGTAAFTRRGRTATISCDDRALGWLGELTADAAAGYGLRPPVYLAELDFETMIELSGPYRVFRGLPRFPAVQRDLAFVVPDDLPAARVTRIIAEAGGTGRHARYLASFEALDGGMRELGFRRLLPEAQLSRILTAYLEPDHPCYDFEAFHDALWGKGFTIYPGKGAHQATFRLANMGAVTPDDMRAFVAAVHETLKEQALAPLYAA